MSGHPTAWRDERGLRTLSWALAFVGMFFIASPVIDWVLTNLPLEVSRLTWRYQALGRLSQTLLTPILGVSVLVGAGALSRNRWMSRIGGIVGIVGAAILIVLAAVFLLDMADARAQVRDEAATIFRLGAIRAMIKFAFGAVGLSLLGLAGLTLAKGSGDTDQEPTTSGADGVVFKSS